MRRRLVSILALAAAAPAAGCGSAGVGGLPPPAGVPAGGAPPAGARPEGRVANVAPAASGLVAVPGTALVALGVPRPAGLLLLDAATGRVERRVALAGAPGRLAADPASGALLVPVPSDGSVARLRVRGGRAPARIAAVGGAEAAVTLPGGRVAVAGGPAAPRPASLAVVPPGAGAARGALRAVAGAQPAGLAVLGAGTGLALVSGRERVLERFDPATGRRTARIPVGVGPTQVAVSAGRVVYVLDTRGDALLVVRARGRRLELERRVLLAGGPYGITIDPVRRRLWVTLAARDEVVELPAHGRPHVLSRHPTVHRPVAVAVSGDRVVVAGAGGDVQRFAAPAAP